MEQMERVIFTSKGSTMRKSLFENSFQQTEETMLPNLRASVKPRFISIEGKPSKCILMKLGHRRFNSYHSNDINKMLQKMKNKKIDQLDQSQNQDNTFQDSPILQHMRTIITPPKNQLHSAFDDSNKAANMVLGIPEVKYNQAQKSRIKTLSNIGQLKLNLENKVLANFEMIKKQRKDIDINIQNQLQENRKKLSFENYLKYNFLEDLQEKEDTFDLFVNYRLNMSSQTRKEQRLWSLQNQKYYKYWTNLYIPVKPSRRQEDLSIIPKNYYLKQK